MVSAATLDSLTLQMIVSHSASCRLYALVQSFFGLQHFGGVAVDQFDQAAPVSFQRGDAAMMDVGLLFARPQL